MIQILGLCLVLFAASNLHAQLQTPQTLEEYNQTLIKNGVSWSADSSLYFPSFYTGFAPKIETSNRIHFHLSRGNQARLTGVLDELAILSYAYGLRARSEFITSASKTVITPVGLKPSEAFQSVVASPRYQVSKIISDFEGGRISREAFYEENLNLLKQLNPGRIFPLRFDLRAVVAGWKSSTLVPLAKKSNVTSVADAKAFLARSLGDAVIAANNLLIGRINTTTLSEAQLNLLAELLADAATSQLGEALALEKSVALLNSLTEGRFDFKVVQQGRYRNAIECQVSGSCDLVYYEFTAIYPNGSVKSYTSDRDGNKIPYIRETGAMNFIARSYHDVDHIRSEGYYGWMTKMDYTDSGNGIHNPAVRTSLSRDIYKPLYETLNIPRGHDTLWVVARGGVSHGCTRMAAGHIHEVRHVFPSNPVEMKKLVYFGNQSSDYDLFDIDGSGRLKVMGVDYLIAYALASDSGAGYREGNGLIDEAFERTPFYNLLYGQKQFRREGEKLIFVNPYVSYFEGSLAGQKRARAISVQFRGEYELYEQAYEQDKLQFFSLKNSSISSLSSGSNRTNRGQQLVRVFGRINACGPFKAEFSQCNEDGFKREAAGLLTGL